MTANLAKKRLFTDIEEAMKTAMKELKDKESIISVDDSNLEGDKLADSKAKKALDLLAKVEDFIKQESYEAAATLLRHVYRVSPSRASRTPLSNARALCREAMVLETKWVRRRATLRKKGMKGTELKREKKKYAFEKVHQIHDLLATAILEISEGIDKRGGEFFTSLSGLYEVALPPLVEGNHVFTIAPIMFHCSVIDERALQESAHKNHNMALSLKKIEQNLYIMRNMPLVGFKEKLVTKTQWQDATLSISSDLGMPVNLLQFCLTHRSSDLFWYTYNLPIKFHTMQFADNLGVENYGELNSSLSRIEGTKISRDEFIKLREAQRINNLQILKLHLQDKRENFVLSHKNLIDEIKSLEDSIQESSEIAKELKDKFSLLTSIELTEENKGQGLPISKYRYLKEHMQKVFNHLRAFNDEEDDILYERIKSDRFNARIVYYEYMDALLVRKSLKNRYNTLKSVLDDARHIARGTGKSLISSVMS